MFLSLFILAFLICSLKKVKRLHSRHFLQERQSYIVEVLQVLYCLT